MESHEREVVRQYAVFGLTVESEIELPELPVARVGAKADISLEIGAEASPTRASEAVPAVRFKNSNEYELVYGPCSISIQDGNQIVVHPVAGFSERQLRWTILGPAFNFLLHQRGLFILHASTVAIEGSAVAFFGRSGAGKSTTAAAFAAANHIPLTDDVAVIDTTTDQPTVYPGFSALKLHDSAAREFENYFSPLTDCIDGEEMNDTEEQFYRPASTSTQTFPLAAIYKIEDGEKVTVSNIPTMRSIIELTRNCYTVGTYGNRDEAQTAINQATMIGETTPVATLRRPRRFSALPELVSVVKQGVSA